MQYMKFNLKTKVLKRKDLNIKEEKYKNLMRANVNRI